MAEDEDELADTLEVAVGLLLLSDGVQLEPFLVMPLIFIFRTNLLASVSSPLSPLTAVTAAASPVLPFRLFITVVFDGTLLLLLLFCSTFAAMLVVVVVTALDEVFLLL